MKVREPLLALVVATASCGQVMAQAEISPAERAEVQKQIEELRATRKELDRQMSDFNRRIEQLESRLTGEAPVAAEPFPDAAPATTGSAIPVDAMSEPDGIAASQVGRFVPGKGFVLASSEMGELSWSAFAYARYLNQLSLNESFTDAFGRTFAVKNREDIQIQKVVLNFKGWLLDERFRYLFYTWSANTSQGDPAQVVIGGNISWEFSDALALSAGIGALPTTRTTMYTFPNWLRNDNRTVADEYFRGSYTQGVWASGKVAPGLEYRVMLGNNLSGLGTSATELDNKLNTVSGALWWMPTTGEFGPINGFGDYENHQELATLFGVNFTHSREDAQGQSPITGFENSQIRLSDGTRLFSPQPFGTGGDVRKATYRMLAMNAGAKYKGLSLDGEYYVRWVDDFETTAPVPVSSLYDTGFQLQASGMLIPKKLQAYVTYSKIFGEFGDPGDTALGFNWFPTPFRPLRVNAQALYLDNSPVGGSSLPSQVGGKGWVYNLDAIVAF